MDLDETELEAADDEALCANMADTLFDLLASEPGRMSPLPAVAGPDALGVPDVPHITEPIRAGHVRTAGPLPGSPFATLVPPGPV